VLDELHIIRRVEGAQLLHGGGTRRLVQDLGSEPLRGKFAHETLMAIRSEGVAIAEPVAGDGFSGDYGNGHGHSPKD
jgi:hypothetical protein